MNCSKHDVVEARVRALRQFGKVRPASAASLIQQPATIATGASFSDSLQVERDGKLRYLATEMEQ
jgi:hypothetical protein